jgi:hypothetical protein
MMMPNGVALQSHPTQRPEFFKTFLLWTSPMANDEVNFYATLKRAANALEHIACSLMAIEMMQAAQDGDGYEESLNVHRRFQHEGCTACGATVQNAPELAKKLLVGVPEGLAARFAASRKS